eukprot:GFUD01033319.1.p1 GENE.GFUD01033319.1~~GFUD01033319.1.p1  ORF type:complete len:752 (-),score=216.18 GFUD01033319.1:74-2329(-)
MMVAVDYLGRWEVEEGMETAMDVMRDLIRRGVSQDYFIPNAELEIREEEIALMDNTDGVKQEVWAYFTNSICDPVAFVNRNEGKSLSSFSRVVVFTILGVGHFDRNPVMFAVQCHQCQPAHLVEKMLQFSDQMRSRAPSATSFPSMYSPTAFATVGKISAASSLRGSVSSQRDNYRKPIPFQSPKLPEVATKKPESLGFDRPSFVYDHSEDQIQKDTILLNYCIDDIETLCRDLRESRSGVGKDGPSKMLEDYKATDFISVFQKFKLAFNILGRLHPEIRDPNAAELVHHLFPPLAFLMDACLDLFDEDVQREVATPFLTPAAIMLLKNCLASREVTIWDACGDYWKLPKSEFDGSTVPYKPLFLDGWSPGYIVFEELEEQKQINRKPSQRAPKPQVVSDTESDYGSDGSVYNVGKQTYKPDKNTVRGGSQEDWRDLLMKSGVEIALVTYTREGANRRELSVVKGDYLEILNTDKKWWKVKSRVQEVGFVPYTILKTLVYKEAEDYWREKEKSVRPRSPSPYKKMPTERHPRSPTPELRRPHSPSPPRRQARSPSPAPRRHRSPSPAPRRHRSPSPAPSLPPPPPPQPIISETPTILRKASKRSPRERSNSVETSYSMAEELRHVLSFYSEEKQRNLDILHTPDIFLDQRSTAREVKEWLKAKQFSSRAQKQMDGMSGRQVLGMNREALEAAFGKEEGGRLDSQIILSRNQTKYTQGKNSELRAILEKAKKRAEVKKSPSQEQLEVDMSQV